MADETTTPLARSLASFGVSGLLDGKCRVFYCNLFSPNHIGRVSDLLAAQLRSSGHDELKLRALLLFSVFEACANRVGSSPAPGGVLAAPITIECGLDADQLALGITVTMPSNVEPIDPEPFARRVRSNEPEGELERFLAMIRNFSDRLVVRSQRATRKIEIVALLGNLAGGGDVEVVLIPDGAPEDAPPAGSYVELGDLDYSGLLQPGARPRGEAEPKSDEETRIAAGRAKSDELVRIGGGDGTAGDGAKTIIVGGGGEAEDDSAIKISGGGGGLEGLIRKIWPFSKKDPASSEPGADEPQLLGEEPSADGAPPAPEAEAESEAPPAAPSGEEALNPEATARRLMVELQAGNLDRTIDKAQREMAELQPQLNKNKRAQRWAEGLMSELLSEKARLHEMARKLNTAVRQKEVEFRNKETGLKEEIRRRDEALRQKENAIVRTKDQVQQLRMAMDRMKATQVAAGDDVHYRQKYSLSQKLYNSAKEENTKLTSQLEQYKTEVGNLRYAAKKGEEYKKQYLALVDKTADKKTGGVAANAAKRVETEAKMAAVYRKEASDLRSRMNEIQLKGEESEREAERLRKEVAKLQADLKAAKGPASGSSSPSSAA